MKDLIARFALEWKRLLLGRPRKTMEVSFQRFRDDVLDTLTIHLWPSANILPKSIESPSYNEINLLYLIASSFIQTHGFEPTLYFLGFP